MCIQIVERYAVCRCLYHRHAIDPCAARNQRGHVVQERIILVGYTCGLHARRQSQPRAVPDASQANERRGHTQKRRSV
ncbi:uncharacterized protein MYCGRDRAFT_32232 [Zymoseptoria tritici IPO323]|uniref:Uncharacterized protein n=1 Tax=Zymoseptoria tritici (strain CBS 115943 / IPO323) TaxID=336722 RepID=F9WZP4_ZYMTI|nr:uncharacterized protein MYCGRDRAFT_32232 [Zymoseptoria tritici IPO323]EGP90926.1 hypothetical protein MYCGRDRAFT_32232 [Zymoseptoria tritici IPO323]